jgi:hypothetical protein
MKIAMDYLHGTGPVDKFHNPELLVATAISNAWKAGMTHRYGLRMKG